MKVNKKELIKIFLNLLFSIGLGCSESIKDQHYYDEMRNNFRR